VDVMYIDHIVDGLNNFVTAWHSVSIEVVFC